MASKNNKINIETEQEPELEKVQEPEKLQEPETAQEPEMTTQEDAILDELAVPYVGSESEAVTETTEKMPESEAITEKAQEPEKIQVTFRFNKNVKLGRVSLKKGDCIVLYSEDANLFVQQKHGEIVQ